MNDREQPYAVSIPEDPQKREERRQELYWALRTRFLEHEEMQEVGAWGVDLVVPINCSYRPVNAYAELQTALLVQNLIALRAMGH